MSRDERVVVLASKLSKSQHTRLTKLSQSLGGTEADSFSSSGTVPVHVKHAGVSFS